MNIMNYWDAPIVQMTLSERGLWLQCEAMKLEILELRNTIYARNKEIADLTEKNDSLIALAKFGRWVLQMRDDSDCAGLDGEDIQDKAVDLGLLAGIKVTENCGDYCNCVGYDFPLTCFRNTDKAKVLDK